MNYRFIVKDPALSDIKDFKSKVRQSFEILDVNITNQFFDFSRHKKLKDHSKFYLKIKNYEKSLEAIRSLKSDNILMRKIQTKEPKS